MTLADDYRYLKLLETDHAVMEYFLRELAALDNDPEARRMADLSGIIQRAREICNDLDVKS